MPNPPHEWRRRRASPVGVDRITVSFRPAIPRRVAPQQSPLPLRRHRQCTSLDHSGTIDAGQPVLIFLSHPWGAVQAPPLFLLFFAAKTASRPEFDRGILRFSKTETANNSEHFRCFRRITAK
jgi:hypothetical protein